jgi:mycothiol system anti-sigma-R factor
MALTCTEIGTLVHPYLDGEFSDEDRVALERHTAECGRCRELVQYEMAFKASLRAKLASPPAPSALRRRVLASLDEVDGLTGERAPSRWLTWLLPTSATAAAAAAIALFVLVPAGPPEPAKASAQAPLIPSGPARPARFDPREIRVALGERAVPVTPDNARRVERMLSSRVGVPVRVPSTDQTAAARVRKLHDRLAAEVAFAMPDGEITMYQFDPRGAALAGKLTRRIEDADVECDTDGKLHQFFYVHDGVGVIILTTQPEDAALEFVRRQLRTR